MNDARSRVAHRILMSKKQPDNASQAGFTIVETLIVLAVAGVMFISAVLLVVGQQSKVEFNQAIRDIQSSIQTTIDQVVAGYYPNPGNFSCDGTAGSLQLTTSGSNAQGSNTGCIFLGKVIQFGVQGTDPQAYIVHTIAGLENNTGSLASTQPRDVAPGLNSNNTANFPDASDKEVLHNGITVSKMYYTAGGVAHDIGAVGFISQLGQYSGGQLLSGTQSVDVVPVNGSAVGSPLSTNTAQTVDTINNNLKSSPVDPDGGVVICFASGGTKQSGQITIGSNGRTLSVNLVIKGSKDCS